MYSIISMKGMLLFCCNESACRQMCVCRCSCFLFVFLSVSPHTLFSIDNTKYEGYLKPRRCRLSGIPLVTYCMAWVGISA